MSASSTTQRRWLSTQANKKIRGFDGSSPDLISKLREYVLSGLEKGETCIIIANGAQIKQLHERRAKHNDISKRLFNDQCLVLNAESTLTNFMDNGVPNRQKFISTIHGLIEQSGEKGQPVRVYCEMVATLWAADNMAAAFELEKLWNKLAKDDSFSLVIRLP